MKIYYNNINGFNSKKQSLIKIVDEVNPDIIALCETKRAQAVRQKKVVIPGYKTIERNLKQGKEGLMVGAKLGSFLDIEDVTNNTFTNILTVRIKYKMVNMRIITLHAPQETEKLEERSDFFDEIATQVERGVNAGDTLVVLGDFNARIYPNDIPGVSASSNGKLLRELLSEYELKIGS